MEIRDFLEHKQAGVLSVAPGHALQQAAEIMTSHGVGALVITDEAGNLLGIVTERDLTRAIATYGVDLIDKPVRDVMTEKVVTCDIDQSVVEVLYLMKSNGVRHIPVLDLDRLTGIVSMRNLNDGWFDLMEDENRTLRERVGNLEFHAAD